MQTLGTLAPLMGASCTPPQATQSSGLAPCSTEHRLVCILGQNSQGCQWGPGQPPQQPGVNSYYPSIWVFRERLRVPALRPLLVPSGKSGLQQRCGGGARVAVPIDTEGGTLSTRSTV